MILTNELKGRIVAKGLTQAKLAKMLGIANKTMYNKMKKGIFNSEEIEAMIKILEINDPLTVFFFTGVADKATY